MKKAEIIDEVDFALTTISGLISDFETGVPVDTVEIVDQLEMIEKKLQRIKKAVDEQMPA